MDNKQKKSVYNRQLYKKNREKRLSQQKEWQKENPGKVKSYLKKWRDKPENREKMRLWQKKYAINYRISKYGRNKFYLQRHKISLEVYNNLFEKQSGLCDVCFMAIKKYKLCVDHDHKTGKIRGLLCGNCNRAIGLLKDNIFLLENAIKYLKKKNGKQTTNSL